MIRRALLSLTVCSLLLMASRTAIAAERADGMLRWSNGDTLPGWLHKSDGPVLQWRSPLFVDPLKLNSDFLKEITFSAPPATVMSKEPFRANLRNGDVIYGALVDITEQHVTLRSDRHGELNLRRDAVRSLMRMDRESLIYIGPAGAAGWGTRKSPGRLTGWTSKPDGHLTTNSPRAELFRAIEAPDTVEIEIALKSTSVMPQFLLAFGDDPTSSIRIETWSDELVATNGDDFASLLTMKPTSRSVDLRLFWRRKSAELTVFSKSGKKLGAVKGGGPADAFGVYLRNLGGDLSLNRIQINKWNGNPPLEIKQGQSRLHLTNGDIAYGEIQRLSAEQQSITLEGSSVTKIPLDKVRIIHLTDEPDAPATASMQVMYFDGALLSGKLQSIEDGKLLLGADYSSAPILADLSGARKLGFTPTAKSPVEGQDMLSHAGGVSRGKVVGGDTPETAILWKPLGAINASPLSPGCQGRIVRGQPAVARQLYDGDKYRDLLFLKSRDIIPCKINAIDEEFIHLKTAFGDATRIPADQVQALELSQDEPQASGFATAGWRVMSAEETVTHNGDQVVLLEGGALGHRSILRADELRFQLKWNRQQPAFVTLRLYVADIDRESSSIDLGFFGSGDKLMVCRQTNRRASFNSRNAGQAELGRAQIHITTTERQLNVFVNDRNVFSVAINRANRRATGAVFTRAMPAGIRAPGPLTISHFQTTRSDRVGRKSYVDEEAKLAALTVPRFRKQNPFTHILLAHNGDLLRGRLTSMTSEVLHFQSRLEEFKFPRSLVSAIVWIDHTQQPSPEAPGEAVAEAAEPAIDAPAIPVIDAPAIDGPAPAIDAPAPAIDAPAPAVDTPAKGERVAVDVASTGPSVRAILASGEIIVLTPEKMTDDRLIGTSESLGRCDLPLECIRELHVGGFGPLEVSLGYSDWTPRPAVEPKFAGSDAGGSGAEPGSELIGSELKDLNLTMLDGGSLQVDSQGDRVVVLDFWATWCGPCVRAMPEYLRVLKEFDEKQVVFVGVNQAEAPATIKKFIEKRKWKMNVALDANQKVARKFNVEGIPHTVILKGGKVQWVHVGFRPGGEQELKEAIEKLLPPAASE